VRIRPEPVRDCRVLYLMSEVSIRSGGCACGAVRFEVQGEPRRVGLCHCMICRKAHGSSFNPFVVYAQHQVQIEGSPAIWNSSANYERWFCAACGSRVAALQRSEGEYELSLGSFDEPGQFEPQYESWIIRREPWLTPLPAPQHCRDRD
jgi:hypothetical protein